MDILEAKHAYSRFVSEIRKAKSEVLVALDSITMLESLEVSVVGSLKQAQKDGVNVMILYSQDGKNEELGASQLYWATKKYHHIKKVLGIHGTLILIDNSQLLTINETQDGLETFAMHSNESIVKNMGSLLDSLWHENEMLESIIAIKNNLHKSNKQLAEANERLKIHDELQQEFVNIAAHELRTPITPILGYAELLEQQEDSLTKAVFMPASYDQDKEKALKSVTFWKGAMIKAFFKADIHDPREIQENGQVVGNDIMEQMGFVISNAEEGIQKIKKYTDLGFTDIVLINSSPDRSSFVRLLSKEIIPRIIS